MIYVDGTDERMILLTQLLNNAGLGAQGFEFPIVPADAVCVVLAPVRGAAALDVKCPIIGFTGKSGANYYSLADDEEFAAKNAAATAEGALMLILQQTDTVLRGANVAVVGYGRIGRELCMLLRSVGANVHVFTDNPVKAAYASMYEVWQLCDMEEVFPRLSVLVNTAPARIITPSCLNSLNKKVFLLELASKPYGFDMECAKGLGLTAYLGAALPALTAPLSAAEALLLAVQRVLKAI